MARHFFQRGLKLGFQLPLWCAVTSSNTERQFGPSWGGQSLKFQARKPVCDGTRMFLVFVCFWGWAFFFECFVLGIGPPTNGIGSLCNHGVVSLLLFLGGLAPFFLVCQVKTKGTPFFEGSPKESHTQILGTWIASCCFLFIHFTPNASNSD